MPRKVGETTGQKKLHPFITNFLNTREWSTTAEICYYLKRSVPWKEGDFVVTPSARKGRWYQDIRYALEQLKKDGRVERVGVDKPARWALTAAFKQKYEKDTLRH